MKRRRETETARILRLNLLEIAKAYAKAKDTTLAIVSAEMYGNRQLLPALARASGTLSIRKYGEMIELFRERWPDKDANWPFLPALFLGRKNNIF